MKFTVDPPELHKTSQTFTKLSGEYKDVYTRLMNTASTMGEAWKSADNLAYVDQINGFCDELKAMTDHLEQAAKALEQQAANYETTRDDNIASVKKLVN